MISKTAFVLIAGDVAAKSLSYLNVANASPRQEVQDATVNYLIRDLQRAIDDLRSDAKASATSSVNG